eukprot:1641722-Alexandrium_andersonii.AAC.1
MCIRDRSRPRGRTHTQTLAQRSNATCPHQKPYPLLPRPACPADLCGQAGLPPRAATRVRRACEYHVGDAIRVLDCTSTNLGARPSTC